MTPSHGDSVLEEFMPEHTRSCYLGIKRVKNNRKKKMHIPNTWEVLRGLVILARELKLLSLGRRNPLGLILT
jgi:hypothetical protein